MRWRAERSSTVAALSCLCRIEVAGVLENDGYEGVKKLVEEGRQPIAVVAA